MDAIKRTAIRMIIIEDLHKLASTMNVESDMTELSAKLLGLSIIASHLEGITKEGFLKVTHESLERQYAAYRDLLG